ncbi:MAG TPA: MerR family transcriptional regulator [Acidimicrobiales bacterium]|nr:MerR family transcriptional regulator [Acidimicrobiales bacterium]
MVERLPERSHLSIGEVLSLLRDEFPDVTISKIRFLESQGLVDPERTPSGYRKFYEHDVERLRWILRQQREHFLPLKVIRGRLTEQGEEVAPEEEGEVEPVTTVAATPSAPGGAGARPASPAPARRRADGPGGSRPATPSLFAGLRTSEPEASDAAAPTLEEAVPAAAPAPAPLPEAPTRKEPAGARIPPERAGAPRQESPVPPPPAPPRSAPASYPGEDADTYSPEELAAAAGADLELVQELKQYGLIAPHAAVAGTQYYEESALAVVRAAAQFARHGVEARHLKMFRNAAEREADLYQQVVLPLLRQRNPQARRQALETLSQLSGAGADLRSALVDRAIRDIR